MRTPITCLATAVLLGTGTPAQSISAIDWYGLRDFTSEEILEQIELAVGDPIEAMDRDLLIEQLTEIWGVAEAKVTTMHLGTQRVVLIGVREEGRPELTWQSAPTGDARLPEGMVADYNRAMQLLSEGIERGVTGEDTAQGYSLSGYEPMRALQLQYVEKAEPAMTELTRVLGESADPEQRRAAAYWIAYCPDQEKVAQTLSGVVLDPDPIVRNNSTRALGVLVEGRQKQGLDPLPIDPQPFITMLDSIEWTDQNKASMMLFRMTRPRDPETDAAIRAGALDGLLDIARWTSEGHAYPAVACLGRLAGLEDEAIGSTYRKKKRDREALEDWLAELAETARTRD